MEKVYLQNVKAVFIFTEIETKICKKKILVPHLHIWTQVQLWCTEFQNKTKVYFQEMSWNTLLIIKFPESLWLISGYFNTYQLMLLPLSLEITQLSPTGKEPAKYFW